MMRKTCLPLLSIVLLALLVISCKSKIKQQEDQLYSRHLQKHIKLSIIATAMPDDKTQLNLLVLNDGQDLAQLRVKEIIDSLYQKDLIKPVLVVAIHTNDRMKELGVADYPDYLNRGEKAGKYADFINNELYFFAKKKATVRKFKTVAIAGCSQGGLSAFDIAWNKADRFDKVGVFSGAFWWRDKDDKASDYSDAKNRIILNKIKSSRKKPGLKYWFYVGGQEETNDRDHDGIIDVVDDSKDLIELIKSKNVCLPDDIKLIEDSNGKHDYQYWSKHFPSFLIWAFGK